MLGLRFCARAFSSCGEAGGHSSSRCAGLSLSRPLLLRSTGSRRAGSVIVAHRPICSAACGIFPDQGSNPCPLHWQADSQPLRHQGSPCLVFRVCDLNCSAMQVSAKATPLSESDFKGGRGHAREEGEGTPLPLPLKPIQVSFT